MAGIKEKPGHFHMRTNDAWNKQMAAASKVLVKTKTEITEAATLHYLKHLAKKNQKLKRALARVAA